MARSIQVIGIEGIPEVKPGDDLAEVLVQAMTAQGLTLREGDLLAVTQKIVSKAEGRIFDLKEIEPSAFALTIARQTEKDPRLVELVLREAKRIVRMDRGVLIVETPHGFVCAHAGVDRSNVGREKATLLPVDPDASARRIREGVKMLTGVDVGVIICDTFGRPWREGLVEVAIGVSGISPLKDYRGQRDKFGYTLHATTVAVADELAAAAGLTFGKTDEIPAAIIRGYKHELQDGSARMLIRSREKDLFR